MRVERDNIVIVNSRSSFSLEVFSAAMWMWVGVVSDAAVVVVVTPSTLAIYIFRCLASHWSLFFISCHKRSTSSQSPP